MGFSRLSAAAYGRLRQAVDEDGEFRARVADAASEEVVGRAGLLWLTRPDGWLEDPAFAEAASVSTRARRGRTLGGVDAKLVRAREQAAKADEARRRVQAQRDGLVAELDRSSAELAEVRSRVAELEDERNAAVRAQKVAETDLSALRRDLKLARAATREAEQELAAARAAAAEGAGPALAAQMEVDAAPSTPARSEPAPAPGVDGRAARAAVSAAAGAASELARALAEAAEALGGEAEVPAAAGTASSSGGAGGAGGSGHATGVGDRRRSPSDRRRSRPKRRQPALPPGVFDDSPEARRHLVSDPAVLVVVDGYNLAREAWTGLVPEEERRRTIALLEEAAVRSGSSVTVVFDGDDSASAPVASRVVRVLFSATGVTADDDIAELLPTVPSGQPVLVVSSDRAVADDARRNGAVVLSSAEYLAAVGR